MLLVNCSGSVYVCECAFACVRVWVGGVGANAYMHVGRCLFIHGCGIFLVISVCCFSFLSVFFLFLIFVHFSLSFPALQQFTIVRFTQQDPVGSESLK